MANYTTKIKSAVEKHSKMFLPSTHLTTTDFFKIKVVYSKEMMPGETLEMDLRQTTRMYSLKNPMFADVKIINRAFFVPYRILFKGFNEFINDTVYYQPDGTPVIPSNVPYITDADLVNLFAGNQSMSTTTTGDVYDFSYYAGNEIKRNFTVKGRIVYNLLHALGIKWNWNSTTQSQRKFSALPLFAFLKIYSDWYGNNAYASIQDINALFNRPVLEDNHVPINEIFNVLGSALMAQYENDYFVSAFDNPMTPNSGSMSSVTLSDSTVSGNNLGGYRSQVTNDNYRNDYSTPVIRGVGEAGTSTPANATTQISQFVLDQLHKLTDYMRRHQIAGVRSLDRYFSRWGIKLDSEKMYRSVYLGVHELDLRISDVMSNSATEGADLGDYAGKGFASTGLNGEHIGHFKYKTDEFGQFIVVNVIMPRVQYVEGADRCSMHVERFDFFTPELELGTQAISQDELKVFNRYSDWKNATDNRNYKANGVFGHINRYAEYKRPYSNLTGDFIIPTRSQGMELESYHLVRQIDEMTPLKHSLSFTTGDNTTYDRVFNVESSFYDHFISSYVFNVTCWMPCSQLFDYYEFDNHGETLLVEPNGVRFD